MGLKSHLSVFGGVVPAPSLVTAPEAADCCFRRTSARSAASLSSPCLGFGLPGSDELLLRQRAPATSGQLRLHGLHCGRAPSNLLLAARMPATRRCVITQAASQSLRRRRLWDVPESADARPRRCSCSQRRFGSVARRRQRTQRVQQRTGPGLPRAHRVGEKPLRGGGVLAGLNGYQAPCLAHVWMGGLRRGPVWHGTIARISRL